MDKDEFHFIINLREVLGYIVDKAFHSTYFLIFYYLLRHTLLICTFTSAKLNEIVAWFVVYRIIAVRNIGNNFKRSCGISFLNHSLISQRFPPVLSIFVLFLQSLKKPGSNLQHVTCNTIKLFLFV